MSRRERTATIRCAEDGCRECAHYAYASRREYVVIMQSQKRRPYLCTRHREPDKVLRPDNLTTTAVVVASRIAYGDHYLPGLFWCEEGGQHGSGFMFGPGFNAHASDFPEGTRLTVTTQIELPESTS